MRRDGVAREYFFAHKQSGGSSAPGIKMFTADRMQSVETTEQTFEAQYQIEMSKAGEMSEKPYLFDPNRPLGAPGRTRRRRYVGPRLKYIYRCSYCGRQFTKTTQSPALGAHKTRAEMPAADTPAISWEQIFLKVYLAQQSHLTNNLGNSERTRYDWTGQLAQAFQKRWGPVLAAATST